MTTPRLTSLLAALLIGVACGVALVELALYTVKHRNPDPGWRVHYDLGRIEQPFKRLLVAEIGLGALVAEEALYYTTFTDHNEERLNGRHAYLLRFAPQDIPEVAAFWSISVYDADSYLVDNPIQRYALNDPHGNMRFDDQGGLEVLVATANPTDHPNWLPAPAGPFSMTLRAYKPGAALLNGQWQPSPLYRQPRTSNGPQAHGEAQP